MVTQATRPEPAHPHGWLGYVVADQARTTNALRLAKWAIPGLLFALAIVAIAVVILTLASPLAAAELLGGGSTATAGGIAVRRWRRRRNRGDQ